MMDKHILAEQDYMLGLKYKEIADKYDVTLNTVKSWKQRHSWQRNKGAPDGKGVHTNRKGAPEGNQNALGNDGGAPKGNSNAVTHGFFRKYLPDDTADIMQQIAERSPLDMLWDQIMIQYAAILRAQQIMFVKDRDDSTTTKIEEKGGNVWGEKWEVQHAWDKQAAFLSAQSRAMSELRSLIKHYEEMCRQDDADEERTLRISKLKAEVQVLEGDNKGSDTETWQSALEEVAKRRREKLSGHE
ncbi:phage terminase small subunit [Paenibacillus sp. UMB4589-SE434]|uniref:phage terminase small subunit n=1 Tax=Paenibacillus sp. UMB4589-SE434 TaxID=3046314 RepID=UPI0025504EA1|nr:phage terminase small subunit [Paenibacillus sp. UMB4589-SE434]MDK8182102.1 phage terminase small subunit [Paenibacillus sp. UMB4589-SE434]